MLILVFKPVYPVCSKNASEYMAYGITQKSLLREVGDKNEGGCLDLAIIQEKHSILDILNVLIPKYLPPKKKLIK